MPSKAGTLFHATLHKHIVCLRAQVKRNVSFEAALRQAHDRDEGKPILVGHQRCPRLKMLDRPAYPLYAQIHRNRLAAMLLDTAVLGSLSLICVIGSQPEPSAGTYKLRGQVSSGDEVWYSTQPYPDTLLKEEFEMPAVLRHLRLEGRKAAGGRRPQVVLYSNPRGANPSGVDTCTSYRELEKSAKVMPTTESEWGVGREREVVQGAGRWCGAPSYDAIAHAYTRVLSHMLPRSIRLVSSQSVTSGAMSWSEAGTLFDDVGSSVTSLTLRPPALLMAGRHGQHARPVCVVAPSHPIAVAKGGSICHVDAVERPSTGWTKATRNLFYFASYVRVDNEVMLVLNATVGTDREGRPACQLLVQRDGSQAANHARGAHVVAPTHLDEEASKATCEMPVQYSLDYTDQVNRNAPQ